MTRSLRKYRDLSMALPLVFLWSFPAYAADVMGNFAEAMEYLRKGQLATASDLFTRVAGGTEKSQYAFMGAVYASLLTLAEEMAAIGEMKLYGEGAKAANEGYAIRKTLFEKQRTQRERQYKELGAKLLATAAFLLRIPEQADLQFPLTLDLRDFEKKQLKQRISDGYFPSEDEKREITNGGQLCAFAALYGQVTHQAVAMQHTAVLSGELDLKEFYFVYAMRLYAFFKTQPSAVLLRTARDFLEKAQIANPKASIAARDAETMRLKTELTQLLQRYDEAFLRRCPVCKRQFPEATTVCPLDGAVLSAASGKGQQ